MTGDPLPPDEIDLAQQAVEEAAFALACEKLDEGFEMVAVTRNPVDPSGPEFDRDPLENMPFELRICMASTRSEMRGRHALERTRLEMQHGRENVWVGPVVLSDSEGNRSHFPVGQAFYVRKSRDT